MDRQPPRASSDEIDLYVRTYYSLLRSSTAVRVRAFEESHLFSRSSLHLNAEGPTPDLAAFAYSAARLPECMPQVRDVVLGQSPRQFAQAGLPLGAWTTVRSRGRRRPMRHDGGSTLAVFVASGSDIDDLVPIVTSYQIEWNKIRECLLAAGSSPASDLSDDAALIAALGIDAPGLETLRAALGERWRERLAYMLAHECDLSLRLLDGSFREYQRSAHRWFTAIAPSMTASRPVYFVSSNGHSLANLLGGYGRRHRDDIVDFLRRVNPEGLAPQLDGALAKGDEATVANILYFSLRAFLHEPGAAHRISDVQRADAECGIHSVASPGRIDVDAQVIELGRLDPGNLDPRARVPGLERLATSEAVILNIDYPLGMAAYHHLAAVALGVEELRGIYVMGKAATLNGRVGDVMIPKVVHDEHSANTYLFRNAMSAADVQPFMRHGTVLDNQKAVTVRSAFLQNREYMDVFYREGYTVMEMEAGPYLSAIYEIAEPKRHPKDELVRLDDTGFELGMLHYASDTPYSRRQSLLSKSLSYFGMESTYGCAIAIVRRIFQRELSFLEGS
ncbi:MAG: hypothetical protein R3B48_05770 [Kofleriaceae bacterium]